MKIHICLILLVLLTKIANSQSQFLPSDSADLATNLHIAEQLSDCQLILEEKRIQTETLKCQPACNWLIFSANLRKYNIFYQSTSTNYTLINFYNQDSVPIADTGHPKFDRVYFTKLLEVLNKSDNEFQVVRDTCPFYFNRFIILNPDKSISVWYLPDMQPSGQLIYGVEWEYIYDPETGSLLKTNFVNTSVKGIWPGQPRAQWIVNKSVKTPSVNSLYFALQYVDYFTKIVIDNQHVTITYQTSGSENTGWIYSWHY